MRTIVVERMGGRAVKRGEKRIDLPRLLAVLAGGRVRPATGDDVRLALMRPTRPLPDLVDLASIASRAGFATALARTIDAAWWAGLDLAGVAASNGHPRWRDLAALADFVRAELPRGVKPPTDLLPKAFARIGRARDDLGAIVLDRVTDLPLALRPLIEALALTTDVVWHSPYPKATHPFVPAGVVMHHPPPRAPDASTIAHSYADPTEEVRAALRWVRTAIDAGVPPGDIGVVALDPTAYEATLLALVQDDATAVHHRDGVPALSTPIGQFLAAWSDAARADRPCVARLVAAAHALPAFGVTLPDAWRAIDPNWDRDLPPFAPLATIVWPDAALGVRDLVARLTDDPFASDLIDAFLPSEAATLWRAIGDRAAAASPEAWRRLRLPDGRDPDGCVAWGSARSFVIAPRPHLRLLGVVSGDWPRAHRDDPLLPRHVLGDRALEGRRRGRADRDDFVALAAAATGSLVLTYPRRGDDGRERLPSPLLLAHAEPIPVAPGAVAPAPFTPTVAAAVAAFTARAAPEATPFDGLLPARHPQLRAALRRPLTTGDLHALLHDPFSFVAQRILRWREPPLDDDPIRLDPAAFGSLVHALVERAAALMGGDVAEPVGSSPLPPAEAIAQATADLDARWRALAPPASEALWRGTLAEAVALARAAFAAGTAVGPQSAFELRFGAPDARPDRLGARWNETRAVTLPGTHLRLRGVIDRLDVRDDGALVTDHKTGAPESEAALTDAGELQRIVYAVAVRAHLGDAAAVESQLLYLRRAVRRPLDDAALRERFAAFAPAVAAAAARLEAGIALPTSVGVDPAHPFRLALPADAVRYRERKRAAFLALQGS